MRFFTWLEGSRFSMWVKDPDTLLGYDLYLASHAVGMAILVGVSVGVALRVLGCAPRVPLAPLRKFFPVMYLGFWINAVSGLVLFVIYPTKPITNPGFYVKLGLIAAAVICIRRIHRQVFADAALAAARPITPGSKRLAAGLLFIWTGAITAGRLMAYHGIANVEWQVSLAMTILAGVGLIAAFVATRRVERETTSSHAEA